MHILAMHKRDAYKNTMTLLIAAFLLRIQLDAQKFFYGYSWIHKISFTDTVGYTKFYGYTGYTKKYFTDTH